MKTLKEILNELREIKKVLQTIASSLEHEEIQIDISEFAESVSHSFTSRSFDKKL